MAVKIPPAKSTIRLNFSIHLHPISFLNVEAHEYVYWPEKNNHKASELIWKVDDICMHGAGLSFKPIRWLAFNADGWFNIFKFRGTMDDYDWLITNMDEWTHWSHHEKTYMNRGNILDANIEFIPFRAGPISFSALIGHRRENWEWKAYGGSFIYSEYGFRDRIFTLRDNQLGITYEQTFHTRYVGIGMKGDFHRFNLKTRFVCGDLVYGKAVDHHHWRNLVTYDDFARFTLDDLGNFDRSMLAFTLTGSYCFTPHIALQSTVRYTKYFPMQGDTEWHYNDEGIIRTYPQGAGAELETLLWFSLSLVLTL